ncbi:MAG: ATP-binding protein [Planctomycetota bacterium]|jgi:MinD superfamily P-loop ATPase
MVPRIDVFQCDGCGVCVVRCPPQVIGLIKGKAAILVDLCEECGICSEVCPIDAVHFRLPNFGTAATHDAYAPARDVTPNPGGWRTGVPLGHDGEGRYKTEG